LMSLSFASSMFFFAPCDLTPAFVTLFVVPWNARVDCCDLAAGADALRLGAILEYLRSIMGSCWLLNVVIVACDDGVVGFSDLIRFAWR